MDNKLGFYKTNNDFHTIFHDYCTWIYSLEIYKKSKTHTLDNGISISYIGNFIVLNVKMIRKVRSQWYLYSLKKHKGKRKILGKFKTKKEALHRERQINFFKYLKK
jgi:hypothetical protein